MGEIKLEFQFEISLQKRSYSPALKQIVASSPKSEQLKKIGAEDAGCGPKSAKRITLVLKGLFRLFEVWLCEMLVIVSVLTTIRTSQHVRSLEK